MAQEFQVKGSNSAAPFTLTIHRGDGMALLAMDWKSGKPPADFVGFAIEYREPGGAKFYALKNRLNFEGAAEDDKAANKANGKANDKPNQYSTLRAPIQKFRWVHFPRNAELDGDFTYRVSPVFMNARDELSLGEPQTAALELRRETYPGKLNVAYTRGFVSSQAFVDNYASEGPISKLLPAKADAGLKFKATHKEADKALPWMGFEARSAVLEVLDEAIADKNCQVRVVAYDLNVPEVVDRLEKLGKRLRLIIDDDGAHGKTKSAERQAELRIIASAGSANVRRQHMGKLQHNKTIVVDGPKVKAVVCGSTNFSWRGFFVQANHAIVLRGKSAIDPFVAAFDNYFASSKPQTFGSTSSARWTDLGLSGIDAKVAFSPHSPKNVLLKSVADDVEKTKSCLFYSLAFLAQTPGPVRDAIAKVTKNKQRFVYGIADKKVGIELQKPDGNLAPVFPAALGGTSLPEPFRSEPSGGGGVRMHHKFLVVDFDKPTARVYLGSYNFSDTADTKNGENLLLIRDQRIAVSFMIEAVRIFDHYHFRVARREAKQKKKRLELQKPPRNGEKPWWSAFYTDPQKVRDRKLFA